MDENDTILSTSKPTKRDVFLQEKFDEEIVIQSHRLDEIAKLLITIQIAVPGLYATALKLINTKSTPVEIGVPIYVTFVFWALALLLALLAILPRPQTVNRCNISDIETFYQKSTSYKYKRIVFSCICFFGGISTAVYSIL